MGSEGPATGGSVGGFLSGFSRGGNAVAQQQYARQQAAQEQQQRRQQMSIEQQRADDEQKLHAAQMEQWNMESLAHAREADYRDRDQLEKEQEQDDNLQKWAVESNAQLASIPGNATPGNGPKMMRDMIQNPNAFAPPQGYGRLLTKHLSFDGLDYDAKTGWTENGKPVDWSKHMQWDVYYVPLEQGQKKIVMSGANWEKYYGVKGLDPTQDYSVSSVSSLVAAATTQRKNDRESNNQDFKERHDALMATVTSARTNISQYESEKRELLRDNSGNESDPDVQALDAKIADEQKREQDAIDEMHPRIRERVTKQTQTPTPKGKTPTPTSSQYKVGDKVTLKNGQTVTITKLNSNGTFQYR